MKTLLSLLLALAAGAVLSFAPDAQARTVGSGRVVTETRAVSGFDSIATQGSIDLVVRQGAAESVEVQGDDNLLPLVETVVEPERRLVVRLRRGESVSHAQPLRVTVTVVRLQAVTGSGSGDISIGALSTPALKLTLAGSGDARLEGLASDSLEVTISGSSDVVATGSAKQVDLRIAGSGDAQFGQLLADGVKVRIAGSGDASVHADKALDVSIAGSGDVRYSGAVTQVSSRIAGSGSVMRK